MRYLNLLTSVICILFSSISFAQQVAAPDVMILEEDMPVPPNCRLIDKVSVRDMGFKFNCGREKVLLEAKVKVVNKGGNI